MTFRSPDLTKAFGLYEAKFFSESHICQLKLGESLPRRQVHSPPPPPPPFAPILLPPLPPEGDSEGGAFKERGKEGRKWRKERECIAAFRTQKKSLPKKRTAFLSQNDLHPYLAYSLILLNCFSRSLLSYLSSPLCSSSSILHY